MGTGETLTMSRKEVPRAGLVKAALAGQVSNARLTTLAIRQNRTWATLVQQILEGCPGVPQGMCVGSRSATPLPQSCRTRSRNSPISRRWLSISLCWRCSSLTSIGINSW